MSFHTTSGFDSSFKPSDKTSEKIIIGEAKKGLLSKNKDYVLLCETILEQFEEYYAK